MAVKLQYLGWACFLIESDGHRVLIDPYIAGHPDAGVPPSPLQQGDFGELDAICVTHAASDHYGETAEIALETNAVVCGGLDVRLHAIAAGVPDEKIALVVSGASYKSEGWGVKALDAKHISFSQLNDGYVTGQPLSYIFDFDGVRIFHSGDTSISADHRVYGELYRPHVALVGVDGVILGGRPICELEPREAAVLVQMLGAGIAVPMHYRPGSGQAEMFLDSVRAICPEVHVRKLEWGETMVLSVDATVAA